MRLGETFDPVYLDASHRRGLHGDPDMAVLWYRHAHDLGATGAASRLKVVTGPHDNPDQD